MSISGYCTDVDNGQAVQGEINIETSSGEVYVDSCDKRGYFIIDSIPCKGQIFRVVAISSKYYTERQKVYCNCDTTIQFHLYKLIVDIMPVQIFFFEKSSTKFSDGHEEKISTMTFLLKSNPNLQMEIIAYTDSLENNKLRRKRAKKVYKSLVKNGVSKNQLVFSDNQRENSLFILNEDSSNFVEIFPTESYIESQPPEKQEELRALNRRVMFNIVRTDLIPEKKKKK
ncbi:MAG: OmpA family protein [Bacteroidales bacterium]|nr:OmpA family protein [Bacteroidales bacterium]